MHRRGKQTHVHADFSDQTDRDLSANPRDRLHAFQSGFVLGDPAIDVLDLTLEEIDVSEHVCVFPGHASPVGRDV